MSPEQIRGETVDVRTDIWSLGVVLQQILGRPAAAGGKARRAMVRRAFLLLIGTSKVFESGVATEDTGAESRQAHRCADRRASTVDAKRSS